ncbi:hypothetical protein [Pelagibacterium halotolerans]|uniref:hypothetical protein n=1 Tax=Pelagibacterium halotolerans TaxID=531813 RepID=UPI0005A07349|nr:hypothetical protein [Pelagibacterium halotolerans]QJR18306.1 hypothetical protein HKM20_07605 [Pelagibacterium halotolerans]
MSLVSNEKAKLTASFMNAVAAGTVTISLIGPLVSTALGTMPAQDIWNIVSLSLFGIVLAVVLHLLARGVLERLRE